MNYIDIIILIFLGIGAFRGYRKGLIVEVISILAFIIAIIAAFKLLHVGIALLSEKFGVMSQFLPYIAFILIFVLVLVLINLLGKIIKKIVDMTLLGSLDNLAGSLVGILKMAIVLSLFLWLTQMVGIELSENDRQSSLLYQTIAPIGPKTISIITSFVPFIGDLVHSIGQMLRPAPGP